MEGADADVNGNTVSEAAPIVSSKDGVPSTLVLVCGLREKVGPSVPAGASHTYTWHMHLVKYTSM